MNVLSRKEELTLSNDLPAHLTAMQMPGAKYYYAHAMCGEIVLQEYVYENCRMFIVDITATCNDVISITNEANIFFLLALHHTLHYRTLGAAEKFLYEHHFNILSSNLRHTEIRVEANKKYSFAFIFMPPSDLKRLAGQLAPVRDFLQIARSREQASLTPVSQVATLDLLRLLEWAKIDPSVIPALVIHILARVTDHVRTKETKLNEQEIERVYQVREFLQENISGHYPLEALAEHAKTSLHLLKKKFRQVYNLSPFDLLRYYRIVRAAYLLLADHHAKIETIAKAAGFKSGRSLARNFHAFYLMSPHEFRDRTKT